jgi:hypothetical protein
VRRKPLEAWLSLHRKYRFRRCSSQLAIAPTGPAPRPLRYRRPPLPSAHRPVQSHTHTFQGRGRGNRVSESATRIPAPEFRPLISRSTPRERQRRTILALAHPPNKGEIQRWCTFALLLARIAVPALSRCILSSYYTSKLLLSSYVEPFFALPQPTRQ